MIIGSCTEPDSAIRKLKASLRQAKRLISRGVDISSRGNFLDRIDPTVHEDQRVWCANALEWLKVQRSNKLKVKVKVGNK